MQRGKFVEINANLKRELTEESQNTIMKMNSTFKAMKHKIKTY